MTSNRIKRILHGIFEANYSFDLEDKRKKNLGPTVKWLEKLDGSTKFTIAYVVQSALGGHQIPIDSGTMAVLRILDLVTEKDAAAGVVPGLERAVGKSKGIEFGSLLHQLGADYTANPFSPAVRELLLQIDPAAKERFPQRAAPREVRTEQAAEPAKPRRRQNRRPQNPLPTKPRPGRRPQEGRRQRRAAHARRRPRPSLPGPPPRPPSRRRLHGAAARPPSRPPASSGPRPKRPRKRPRRRDSPNANHARLLLQNRGIEFRVNLVIGVPLLACPAVLRPAVVRHCWTSQQWHPGSKGPISAKFHANVSSGKRFAVHIHALSLAPIGTPPRCKRRAFLAGRKLLKVVLTAAAVLAGGWLARSAGAEPSPPPALPASTAPAVPQGPLEDAAEPFVPKQPPGQADLDRREAMALFAAGATTSNARNMPRPCGCTSGHCDWIRRPPTSPSRSSTWPAT